MDTKSKKKTLGFIVLAILIIATLAVMRLVGIQGKSPFNQHISQYEKYLCPRCENDPELRKTCQWCGQTGIVNQKPDVAKSQNLKKYVP